MRLRHSVWLGAGSICYLQSQIKRPNARRNIFSFLFKKFFALLSVALGSEKVISFHLQTVAIGLVKFFLSSEVDAPSELATLIERKKQMCFATVSNFLTLEKH